MTIPRGPIGFRLANELEGLLTGIRADGRIVPAETQRVQTWLIENKAHADIQPFSEIARSLEAALGDGELTMEECDDLLFVVSKLTKANPHFDQMRAGLQVLLGLLAGVAADSDLPAMEIARLEDWIEDWAHLRGLWPFDECESIVTSIALHQKGVSAEHLFALAEQFPIAGHLDRETGELPPLLIQGVCAIAPDIEFPSKLFAFTGDSPRSDRARMEELVTERGGAIHPRITKAVNYLVVCEDGNPHWAFSCYGRKVQQAYDLRREGWRIAIVHERDFWDALNQ